MSRTEAQQFVSAVWSGVRPRDAYFDSALAVLGISPQRFASLETAARKVTRGLGRGLILTPTGAGRNR